MPLLDRFGLALFVLISAGTVVSTVRWRLAPPAQRPARRAAAVLGAGQTLLAGAAILGQVTPLHWPRLVMVAVAVALISRGSRDFSRAHASGTRRAGVDG